MGSLEDWLATYTSEATIQTYRSELKGFLHQVFGKGEVAELADKILEKSDQEIQKAINRYFAHIKRGNPSTGKAYAPKTIQHKLTIVRTFFRENFREFPAAYWARFTKRQMGRIQAIHEDKVPTSDELRRIFSQMKVYGKAYFLLMAATGMRIGETSLIELDDVDMDSDPPRIHLRAETTKGGMARTVFFTAEAKEMLEEWLKVRDAWIVKNRLRSRNQHRKGERPGPEEEKRLFPFTRNNARYIWNTAVKKSQKGERDKRTGWLKMRPHTVRKRFRTQLGAVIPVDVVEVLMGHAVYMGMYVRHTKEELAEFYKEGEHVLYLSAEQLTLKKLERKMQERDVRIEKLEEELQLLKGEALLDEALED